MLNNVIAVVQDKISEDAQEQFGDKIYKIPESVVRKMCGGAGADFGGAPEGYLCNI